MIDHILKFKVFESIEEPGVDWYYGIADCHGLESFIKAASDIDDIDALYALGLADRSGESISKEMNGTIAMMKMRCHANQQRWPVIYMAKLSNEDAEMVQELFDSGDYINALEVVKHNSVEIKLARRNGASERTWNRIPNPELDPFH